MSGELQRRWRVVIVDDEPPARQTLSLLLAAHQDFDIVAECSHGEEAIDAVLVHAPDALLLDVQMPGLDGVRPLRTQGVRDPCAGLSAEAVQ